MKLLNARICRVIQLVGQKSTAPTEPSDSVVQNLKIENFAKSRENIHYFFFGPGARYLTDKKFDTRLIIVKFLWFLSDRHFLTGRRIFRFFSRSFFSQGHLRSLYGTIPHESSNSHLEQLIMLPLCKSKLAHSTDTSKLSDFIEQPQNFLIVRI